MGRACCLAFWLGLSLAVGACSGEPSTVDSTDGVSRITIPGGWSVETDMHDQGDIQVSRGWDELYLVVLTEAKEDFDELDYEEHSDLTRGALVGNLKNTGVSAPKQLTIGGLPAVQYEIRGTGFGLNLVYLHTTVDGKDHFHQILAWTLRSKFAKNGPILAKTTASFRER